MQIFFMLKYKRKLWYWKIIKIREIWKKIVNTSSNLLTRRTKTAQYGIRYRYLMPRMTNPGYSGKDIVKWEPFMNSVWLRIRRTICLNFRIRNCSEIPKKTSFKKEKNNLKIITTRCYPLSILRNYLTCYNFLIPISQRNRRNRKRNH